MCRGRFTCICSERATSCYVGPSSPIRNNSAEHNSTTPGQQNAPQINPQERQSRPITHHSIEQNAYRAQHAKHIEISQHSRSYTSPADLVQPSYPLSVPTHVLRAPPSNEITVQDRDYSSPGGVRCVWTESRPTVPREPCIVTFEETADLEQDGTSGTRGLASESVDNGRDALSSVGTATLVVGYADYVREQYHTWRSRGTGALYQEDEVYGRGRANDDKTARNLACPFCKLDPAANYDCINKALPTLARVKEHIKRQHSRPICCPRCYAEFDKLGDQEAHLREIPLCQMQAANVIGGYEPRDKAQRDAMSQRASSKATTAEQWKILFRAFFPAASVPDSPWVDAELLTITALWQRFVEVVWPVIWDELRSQLPGPCGNQEVFQRAFAKELLHAAKIGLIKEQASVGKQLVEQESTFPTRTTTAAAANAMSSQSNEFETNIASRGNAFMFTTGVAMAHPSEASEWLDLLADGDGLGAKLYPYTDANQGTFADADMDEFMYTNLDG